MPMPAEYARASQDFDRFIEDLRLRLDHDTRHQTYQTLESVLRIFRSRLNVEQTALIGNALPPVVRAIFYGDWKPEQAPLPFADTNAMEAEVRGRRRDHDFSPPGSIRIVAETLRRHSDPVTLESALAKLSREAQTFWAV